MILRHRIIFIILSLPRYNKIDYIIVSIISSSSPLPGRQIDSAARRTMH